MDVAQRNYGGVETPLVKQETATAVLLQANENLRKIREIISELGCRLDGPGVELLQRESQVPAGLTPVTGLITQVNETRNHSLFILECAQALVRKV